MFFNKKRKGYVDITLKKEYAKDILVKDIPEKIKLNGWQTYLALRFDNPAFHVRPFEWGNVILAILLYLSMFIVATFIVFLYVFVWLLLLVASIVGNVIYTKNYYFNYISKRVAEGYAPATDAEKELLKNAGILVNPNLSTQAGSTQQVGSVTTATPQANTTQQSAVVEKDYVKELEKIASLKEKGILTQEEFDEQKKKILAQM